jgi:hypothetical protein
MREPSDGRNSKIEYDPGRPLRTFFDSTSEGIKHNMSTFNWPRLTWPAWALRPDKPADGADLIPQLQLQAV